MATHAQSVFIVTKDAVTEGRGPDSRGLAGRREDQAEKRSGGSYKLPTSLILMFRIFPDLLSFCS